MASQPVKRQYIATLAAEAYAHIPDLPPDLPDDDAALAYLCAYLEQGGRLSSLATKYGYSRFLLDRWIRGDRERQSHVLRARALGADALVDEGGDLLDSATKDTIQVANARAGWRKWLAGKYDPQTYGDQQAPQGQTHLHLHAALSLPIPVSLSTPLLSQSPPLNGSLGQVGEGEYPTASEGELKRLGGGEIVIEPPLETGGGE